MEHLTVPVSYREWNPPVYYCKKATKPFVLDGNINKEFWADAPFTDEFLDIEGEHMPTPRFHTRAKMLWDEENFYFGAILEGNEIWANLTERDCVIFHDNDFEIFIDTDSDTHQYYEFEMNALNTVWDLFLTKPYRDFGGRPLNGWDIKGLQTAVHIEGELNNPDADNRCWMVEVVMPFAALREMAEGSRLPKAGDYYRVNFSRVQWDVDVKDGKYCKQTNPETGLPLPENNWVWAPTGVINIHYPEHWGFVFFTEDGEEYPIPETEKAKAELRKVYYFERRHFDRHGHYAERLEDMELDMPVNCDPEILVAGRKFQASCITKDGKHRVFIYEDGKTEAISVEKLEAELRRPPVEVRNECSEEEYGYVCSLYKNMPLADIGSCDPSYFVKVVRQAMKARKMVPWGEQITDELFKNYVLPYRINNENPVFYQEMFFNELYPIIKDLDVPEAAIAVNYWCMSKAVYQSTNDRTGSPFTVINNAFGRCGEESTLAVSALRSAGIPARQCYAPRWSHCDDNHAWVEVHTGDGWHYLGACEPEDRLDTGWYKLAASKAMLINTRVFSDTAEGEILVKSEATRQEVNALSHYAETEWLTVKVTDSEGNAVQGAQVGMEVVNYSEFFPIATLITDENGEVSILTGKGDILLHIDKDGKYMHCKVDVRETKYLTVNMDESVAFETESYNFCFVPPVGGVKEGEGLSEAELAAQTARFEASQSCRLEREATFPEEAEEAALEKELGITGLNGCLKGARGNWKEVETFLRETPAENRALAVRLLHTLLQKDLSDIDAETLKAHLNRGLRYEGKVEVAENIFDKYLLCPRIGIEFITAFHTEVEKRFTEKQMQAFREEPWKAGEWVENHILLASDLPAPIMSACPEALLRLGCGNAVSRRILTVAILRTCGVPARLEVSDGCVAYWYNGEFVRWGRVEEAPADACIKLVRESGDLREYYKNVTIGRLENGLYKTLDFGNQEWQDDVLACAVKDGYYRIITTDRQPNESNLVQVEFVKLESGETVTHQLAQMEGMTDRKEIALSDRVLKEEDGSEVSLHQLLGEEGKHVVCWIQPGEEPTEHLLNELIENAQRFGALKNKPVLCVKESNDRNNKTLQKAQDAVGNLRVVEDGAFNLDKEFADFEIQNKKLPLVIVSDGITGHYAFSGYQVGIGEMILKCQNF